MIRRDFIFTIVGIGAGQLILLAATPLLARMYGPEAFGNYAVAVSLAGILATIAALRLDLALSGARDQDVAALCRAGLVLPFAVVPLAIGVLALAAHTSLANSLPFDAADLGIIGLMALVQGLVFVASGLSTRSGAFATLAAIKVAQPLVFAITALLLIHDLSLAMIVGWIGALLVSIAILWRVPIARGWGATLSAVRGAWRFPAISTPMALLDVLALALPLLAIAYAFGDQAAGNYSQVQRLIGAPLILVATAGGQIFLKYAGDRVRAGEPVLPLLKAFVLRMFALAAAAAIVVALIGEPLFALLVGPGWRTDTQFLMLTLLPVLWRVIASPVSSILIVTHRLATLAGWQVTYFLVTAAVLVACIHQASFEATLAALAISELIMYGAYLALSVRAARHSSGYPATQHAAP